MIGSPGAPGLDLVRRVPSLDGLRAISIASVLFSHAFYRYGLSHDPDWLFPIRAIGPTGVNIFFGISGYIITSLLLRERHRTGRIDLREFYVRRAFRILPAFWLYAFAITLLGAPLWPGELRNALFFVTNYWPSGWWLGHTWSLSVEEQFYLLWPATLILLGAGAPRATVWILVLSPVIRVVHHLAIPTASLGYCFHTRMDALAVGSWLAMRMGDGSKRRYVDLAAKGGVAAAAGFFLAVGSPMLRRYFHGAYEYPFGDSLEAFCVGSVLMWSIRNPGSRVGRLLNTPIVARVGVLSYGIYLWQEPFFSPEMAGSAFGAFPLNVLTPLLLAEVSYRFAEQPALRARDRVIRWMRERREPLTPAA